MVKECEYNYNCEQCGYADCIVDGVTATERLEQNNRDRNYFNDGFIPPAKRQRRNRGRTT